MPKIDDVMCLECGEFEEVLSMKEDERQKVLDGDYPCSKCKGKTKRVFLGAPSIKKLGNFSQSPSEVDAMKQSFKQRFIKKELDDVRHKHGNLFDDSLRSSAAQRIKESEGLE